MNNLKIIYYRENLLQSVLADISTFSFLVATFYVNYRFIDNNTVLSIFLLIMFWIFVTSKSSNKKHVFTSFEEVESFIKDEKAKAQQSKKEGSDE